MVWKKLLQTDELIAYEKLNGDVSIRIEARYQKKGWRIYKTYNFMNDSSRTTHVEEYIATTKEEAKTLLTDLQREKDLTLDVIKSIKTPKVELKRCYKEEYVEKWKFNVDDFNEDNTLIVRYDNDTKLDIVLHERYKKMESKLLDKIIGLLGLKDISSKITYDFYYFRKHSGKRRIYEDNESDNMLAFEFNLNNNSESNSENNEEF